MPGANFLLHNSEFLIAHFHIVIMGGTIFGVIAGYTYWFSRFSGSPWMTGWASAPSGVG